MTHFRKSRSLLMLMTMAITLVSDARGADLRKIADLNPGSSGSYPSNFTTFSGSLYFSAYTLETGRELFRYNGTGVELVADINETADDIGSGVMEGNDSLPTWLTELNGALYFSAYEPRRGGELWSYNGVSTGRVADISPDLNDTIKFMPNSSWPSDLTIFNNALYFMANSGTTITNYELWKYDGALTSRVANIHPDIGADQSSYPHGFTSFNGALYFMADDGTHGFELWQHDGSSAVMLKDINAGGPESSSYPKFFTIFNNELYFQAFTAEYGFELWKTDGTNVTLAADINAGPESSFVEFLAVFDGSLYFRATDALGGYELWKFDGATASLAAEINPLGDSFPKNLIVFNDAMYFAADDGVHGWELWKYANGEATRVTDLNTTGDSFPESLTVSGGEIYFVATTPEEGYEIFKYDGSSTVLSADINPGPGSSYPQFITAFNGELIFRAAEDGFSDWEIWAISPDEQLSVTLISPVDGAIFSITDTITFSASATGATQVEFFANESSIGTAIAEPFSITTTLPAGSYVITAKATSGSGATVTSDPVSITVSETQPPSITSIAREGTEFRIIVTGTGLSLTLQATSDFQEWTDVATSTPENNSTTFTEALGEGNRFYRVVVK